MKIEKINGKLELRNDGELEIFFIGCGTSFTRTLFNNNLFIIKGNVHLLVDFGFNAPVALQKHTKINPTDIEAFLPTHSHADHIGGVEYLALINRYVGRLSLQKSKLKLITTDEYVEVLWNNSLKGGLQWNEASDSGQMEFNDYFEHVVTPLAFTEPRKVYKLNFNGIDLELFSTNHIPDSAESLDKAFFSVGLFIDNRIFFSGDTKFDPALINMYAEKSEVMFHDCSFEKNPVHCSIEELRRLPASIKKKMYLMHYGDDYQNHDVSDFAGLVNEGMRYIF